VRGGTHVTLVLPSNIGQAITLPEVPGSNVGRNRDWCSHTFLYSPRTNGAIILEIRSRPLPSTSFKINLLIIYHSILEVSDTKSVIKTRKLRCGNSSIFGVYNKGTSVTWGTMLQVGRSRVRFPIRLLDFSIDLMLPAVLWPWGRLSL
jgi:hypothetical protein